MSANLVLVLCLLLLVLSESESLPTTSTEVTTTTTDDESICNRYNTECSKCIDEKVGCAYCNVNEKCISHKFQRDGLSVCSSSDQLYIKTCAISFKSIFIYFSIAVGVFLIVMIFMCIKCGCCCCKRR